MHGGVNAKRNMQTASIVKMNGKYFLAFKGIVHFF